MFIQAKKYDECEPAGVTLPKIPLSEELLVSLDLPMKASSYNVLEKLCLQGLHDRKIVKKSNFPEYEARLEYELSVFKDLGFVDYILLNWDIWVRFAKNSGIVLGAGRGSACGSLVLYLIRVTDVDPIEGGLIFERFVSKARAKTITGKDGFVYLDGSLLPDVDTDCCIFSRD
jgi:DNA polymerase III subunit alpha